MDDMSIKEAKALYHALISQFPNETKALENLTPQQAAVANKIKGFIDGSVKALDRSDRELRALKGHVFKLSQTPNKELISAFKNSLQAAADTAKALPNSTLPVQRQAKFLAALKGEVALNEELQSPLVKKEIEKLIRGLGKISVDAFFYGQDIDFLVKNYESAFKQRVQIDQRIAKQTAAILKPLIPQDERQIALLRIEIANKIYRGSNGLHAVENKVLSQLNTLLRRSPFDKAEAQKLVETYRDVVGDLENTFNDLIFSYETTTQDPNHMAGYANASHSFAQFLRESKAPLEALEILIDDKRGEEVREKLIQTPSLGLLSALSEFKKEEEVSSTLKLADEREEIAKSFAKVSKDKASTSEGAMVHARLYLQQLERKGEPLTSAEYKEAMSRADLAIKKAKQSDLLGAVQKLRHSAQGKTQIQNKVVEFGLTEEQEAHFLKMDMLGFAYGAAKAAGDEVTAKKYVQDALEAAKQFPESSFIIKLTNFFGLTKIKPTEALSHLFVMHGMDEAGAELIQVLKAKSNAGRMESKDWASVFLLSLASEDFRTEIQSHPRLNLGFKKMSEKTFKDINSTSPSNEKVLPALTKFLSPPYRGEENLDLNVLRNELRAEVLSLYKYFSKKNAFEPSFEAERKLNNLREILFEEKPEKLSLTLIEPSIGTFFEEDVLKAKLGELQQVLQATPDSSDEDLQQLKEVATQAGQSLELLFKASSSEKALDLLEEIDPRDLDLIKDQLELMKASLAEESKLGLLPPNLYEPASNIASVFIHLLSPNSETPSSISETSSVKSDLIFDWGPFAYRSHLDGLVPVTGELRDEVKQQAIDKALTQLEEAKKYASKEEKRLFSTLQGILLDEWTPGMADVRNILNEMKGQPEFLKDLFLIGRMTSNPAITSLIRPHMFNKA